MQTDNTVPAAEEVSKKSTRLDEIIAGRKCKQMGPGTTPEARAQAHRVKMEAKKIVRNYHHQQMSGPQYIAANLGRNHPDYGMTVSQHLAEKNARVTEKNS